MTEEELVDLAIGGNPDAINELLGLFLPRVKRFVMARLVTYAGGKQTAEDTVQEIMIAILKALPGYRVGQTPFAAWIFAIANNKVADAQRRYARAPILAGEAEIGDRPDLEPTPEEQVLHLDRLEHDGAVLEVLLATLAEPQAEILLLRANGHSAQEVGDRLGLTANAVRVAQHRAMKRLQMLLRRRS